MKCSGFGSQEFLSRAAGPERCLKWDDPPLIGKERPRLHFVDRCWRSWRQSWAATDSGTLCSCLFFVFCPGITHRLPFSSLQVIDFTSPGL